MPTQGENRVQRARRHPLLELGASPPVRKAAVGSRRAQEGRTLPSPPEVREPMMHAKEPGGARLGAACRRFSGRSHGRSPSTPPPTGRVLSVPADCRSRRPELRPHPDWPGPQRPAIVKALRRGFKGVQKGAGSLSMAVNHHPRDGTGFQSLLDSSPLTGRVRQRVSTAPGTRCGARGCRFNCNRALWRRTCSALFRGGRGWPRRSCAHGSTRADIRRRHDNSGRLAHQH